MELKYTSKFGCLWAFYISLIALCSSSSIAQADAIDSGVTIHWSNLQTSPNDPATLESVVIDGATYSTFTVPSNYSLLTVGPSGHANNSISLNGADTLTGSDDGGWALAALDAYQSLNLNYHVRATANGDDFCDDYTSIATTDAQVHSLMYDPGIPSNAGGIIAVTSRAANGCFLLEVYGYPAGGGPEQLLGRTFSKGDGPLSGAVPQTPPTADSDYWSSGRTNADSEIIGIAFFPLSELAPLGATITSIRQYEASTATLDGKLFLLQSYVENDRYEVDFEQEINANLNDNDHIPAGAIYTVSSAPASGSLTLNPDGSFSYMPDAGFSGTDVFLAEVCLPAPNENVCETAQVELLVKPSAGISDASANEGANLTFTITSNEILGADVVFDISYDLISAKDIDFIGPDRVTLPANSASVTFDIMAVDDSFIELAETFNVTLSNALGEVTITDGSGTATINDNDNTPDKGIDFQDASISITEGDPGDSISASFILTFNGEIDTDEVIEVDYLVTDGTAFNLTDYDTSPVAQTVVFTATDRMATIDVPIISDTNAEAMEQFTFDLLAIRSNVGIRILASSAVGIINDDDTGTLSVNGFSVDEEVGSASFEIVYSGATIPGGFTIDYDLMDISTSIGSDYTIGASSGQLGFPGNDGDVETVTVYINNDGLVEPDETLQLTISNSSLPTSVTFANTTALGTITNANTGQLSITGFTVGEVPGTAFFDVVYSGDAVAGGFSVPYTISDISTTSGSDYNASSTGTLDFSGMANETLQIGITIIQDALIEGDEELQATLSPASIDQITLDTAVALGTITDIDHLPTAVDDASLVIQNQADNIIDVLGNDDYGFDGPATSNALQIVAPPANGILSLNDNGTTNPLDDYFVYDPGSMFSGIDSFTYRITDTNGSSDEAVVNLFVDEDNLRKPFEIRYSETLNGDYTMIANTVLSRTGTADYNGDDGNHDFSDNVFVDIDSDPATFNSSSANFVNPEPLLSCLNIKKAFIYWAAADREYNNEFGLTTGTGDPADEPNWNFNEVMLMLPGESSYTTITADDIIYRGRDDGFQNDPYVCFKDITNEVNALATPFGNYQVGNVKATEFDLYSYTFDKTGTSGGWQIAFVYENSSLDPKNITLFDGYVHTFSFFGEGNDTEFNFNGFQTIPNGNVNASLLIGTLEGDRDLNGDQLQIFDTSDNWVSLSTPLRNQDNFFNSRISVNNSDFIDRIPASTNTLGYDAALFNLDNPGNTLISNNQSFVRFRINTDQESYGLYLMGLGIEVYRPSLGPLGLTINGENNFNAGETIPLSLNVTNSGNDNIANLVITLPVPAEAEFDNASTLPPGVTHSYDASSRLLTFTVANGTIDMGDSFTIDFELQLNPSCYFLETSCSTSFDLQATATYSGELNPTSITTASSGATDSCGIGSHDPTTIHIATPMAASWSSLPNSLDRTVSCDDLAGRNAASLLEPTIDNANCSLNLHKLSGPFVPSVNCPTEGTYTNSWTFTDACGRTSPVFTQTITIEDTTAPTFNETLPNSIAAYDNIPPPPIITANDNCDDTVMVSFNESYIGDPTDTTYTIERTWIATDCVGNSTTQTQLIFVTRTGNAIGIKINDITVNEDAGTATLEVLHTGSVPDGFSVNYTTQNNGTAEAARDYTASSGRLDFMGQHGEIATITVPIIDDTILEGDEFFTVEISAATNTPTINDAIGEVTIQDNDGDNPNLGLQFALDNIVVNEGDGTVALSVVLGLDVQEEFTVDFFTSAGSATDVFDYIGVPAGTQSLTFGGTQPNTQQIVIPIIDDISIENIEHFTVALNNISTDLVRILNNGLANVSIIDNDGDGNFPQDTTIEACGPVPPFEDIPYNDTCPFSQIKTETIEGNMDSCPTEYTITRTWMITDCFGNERTNTQVITVEDTVPPTFVETLPGDVTTECNEIPEAATLTAEDSCDTDISVDFTETITNDANCVEGYTIVRNWSATDCAGNTTSHTQTITIVPNPIVPIDPPEGEISILCADEVPDVPELEFEGGCGGIEVVFTEETVFLDGEMEDFKVTRIWVVTDSCGNTATFQQIILVAQNDPVEVTIGICIGNLVPIDFLDYLPDGFDPNGTYTTEDGSTLPINGSILDTSNLEVGEYRIAYESERGPCEFSVEYIVEVTTDCLPCNGDEIKANEVITPNGDTINDTFTIKGDPYCNFRYDVIVFNRWGDKVFEKADYQNNWGGTAPGGSFGTAGTLPQGTYYYIVSVLNVETNEWLEPVNGYIYLETD